MSEKLSRQMDMSCSETMLPETLLRRWVQAVFRFSDGSNSSFSKEAEANNLDSDNIGQEIKQNNVNAGLNDSSIDLSEVWQLTCLESYLPVSMRLFRSTLEAGISRLGYFQKSTNIPANQRV